MSREAQSQSDGVCRDKISITKPGDKSSEGTNVKRNTHAKKEKQ